MGQELKSFKKVYIDMKKTLNKIYLYNELKYHSKLANCLALMFSII